MKILLWILAPLFLILLALAINKARADRPTDEADKKKSADKPEKKETKEKRLLKPLAWTIWIVAAIGVLYWYYYGPRQREVEREQHLAIAKAVAAEHTKEAFAARLRNATVLPDSELVFTYVATESDSTIFLRRRGYCVSTEAKNPAESYVYHDQEGRHLVRAGPVDPVVQNPEYFYMTAYGGPTTEVIIRSYRQTPRGECKDPTRITA